MAWLICRDHIGYIGAVCSSLLSLKQGHQVGHVCWTVMSLSICQKFSRQRTKPCHVHICPRDTVGWGIVSIKFACNVDAERLAFATDQETSISRDEKQFSNSTLACTLGVFTRQVRLYCRVDCEVTHVALLTKRKVRNAETENGCECSATLSRAG